VCVCAYASEVDMRYLSDSVQIFDFELSSGDFEAINKLNRNLRRGAPIVVRNG